MSLRTPVLAVDLGGSAIKAEVLGADLQVLATGRFPTPPGDGDAVLGAVVALGRRLIDEVGDSDRPVGMGLAVPGLVDARAGRGVLSTNLGWRDVPVAATVAGRLRLPVVLTHDVTAAGYAEHRLGAGRGVDDLLVVVLGTGIAASLIVGGRLVSAEGGNVGELGHVVVRPTGPRCGCGRRGCLEAVASAAAIARSYRERTGRTVDGAHGVRMLLGCDPVADQVWADAVDALADGLLAALALLGSTCVVVGGGLADAGEALLGPLRSAVRQRATVERVPEIVPAALGARAGLIGAALGTWDPAALGARVHFP